MPAWSLPVLEMSSTQDVSISMDGVRYSVQLGRRRQADENNDSDEFSDDDVGDTLGEMKLFCLT